MTTLWHGDCLKLMKNIPDGSIDLILTDPPYGTTSCKWDTIIPMEPMWKEIWRVLKDDGVCALFGNEPFSSKLRMSQISKWRYDWIWKKHHKTGHLNAKKRPMKQCELINIFFSKQPAYYPQGLIDYNRLMVNSESHSQRTKDNATSTVSGGLTRKPYKQDKTGYPTELIEFKSCNGNKDHPTQKPVDLLEYLINTYTLIDQTVLDFTMGSGSTGVAAKNLGRRFIGIEKEQEYYDIACARIGEI